jgi:hypothetical protein
MECTLHTAVSSNAIRLYTFCCVCSHAARTEWFDRIPLRAVRFRSNAKHAHARAE